MPTSIRPASPRGAIVFGAPGTTYFETDRFDSTQTFVYGEVRLLKA